MGVHHVLGPPVGMSRFNQTFVTWYLKETTIFELLSKNVQRYQPYTSEILPKIFNAERVNKVLKIPVSLGENGGTSRIRPTGRYVTIQPDFCYLVP